MKSIRIEIFSDYICPWCYIGIERLIKLKKELQDEVSIKIISLPFQLYPTIPVEGVPKEYMAKRTRPGMGKTLKQETREENITISYRKINLIPNSLEAHRLTSLVVDEEAQMRLGSSIFGNYFGNGVDIGSKEELYRIGKDTNISEDILDRFMNTAEGMEKVSQLIAMALEENVMTVPTLRLQSKFYFPGLQDSEIWRKYIIRSAAKSV